MDDNHYYVVIIDNNTKKMWIYDIVYKDEFFLVFKI